MALRKNLIENNKCRVIYPSLLLPYLCQKGNTVQLKVVVFSILHKEAQQHCGRPERGAEAVIMYVKCRGMRPTSGPVGNPAQPALYWSG